MEIFIGVVIWISMGVVGSALMAFGVGASVKKFLPFGVVFAPVAVFIGVVWALLALGDN